MRARWGRGWVRAGAGVERPALDGSRQRFLLLIIGIVLISANLRPSLTAVGPLIGEIQVSTGLSAGAAGLLTSLPVFAFAIVSPLAPRLGRLLGIEAVLAGSALVLTVGILVRWAPGLPFLFAGTVVIGAAITLANVLVPALVKRDFPRHAAAMTAVYSTVLASAGAVGSGVAVPLSVDLGLGWRGSLAFWAIPAALAGLVLLPRLRRRYWAAATPRRALRLGVLWRLPLVWMVTMFWGMQAFVFYTTVTWLPEILVAEGLTPAQSGLLLFVSQLVGLVATFGVPLLAARRPDQRAVVVVMVTTLLAGVLGLIIAGGTAPLLWVVLLGLGQGAGFSLSLMFFVLRSDDHHVAAQLSGQAQAVGYLIAASGPVIAGMLHDASGAWTASLVVLFGAGVAQLMFGLGAARDAVVAMPQDGSALTSSPP